MSLIRSTPGGLKLLGVRRLLGTSLVACLAPSVIGAGSWLILRLAGPDGSAGSVLGNWAGAPGMMGFESWGVLATLAMLSPFLTGPFWLALTMIAGISLRHGSYGALIAGAAGFSLGALALTAAPITVLPMIGAVLALFHRLILGAMAPEAF